MDQKGSLKVDGPTGFAILTCDQPILSDPEVRASLNNTLAVFEGDLSLFRASSDENGLNERQYIVKLGYYKNDDIDVRLADLGALNVVAKDREGHCMNEAFLNVDDAMGMVTPDEVVMIHYSTHDAAILGTRTNYIANACCQRSVCVNSV